MICPSSLGPPRPLTTMPNEKHCPGCGAPVAFGTSTCQACGKDLAGLWTPSIEVPSAPSQSLNSGATGSVAQASATRPWPFSADILADRLVVSGYLQKPAVDELVAQ